jgi:hypothetical protein
MRTKTLDLVGIDLSQRGHNRGRLWGRMVERMSAMLLSGEARPEMAGAGPGSEAMAETTQLLERGERRDSID